MAQNDQWAGFAKRLLRAEMARRGVTYEGLAELLAEQGHKDTGVNLRNKVARGSFTAAFFLQCLKAMGCGKIELD